MGFLPTSSDGAMGAPWSPSISASVITPIFGLTYHKEFRNSDRHKIVIDWLKKIFDPKTYPCFRDEFIHPNDLGTADGGIERILDLRGM